MHARDFDAISWTATWSMHGYTPMHTMVLHKRNIDMAVNCQSVQDVGSHSGT